MSDVLHLVGVFFNYAVLAIFAQNAVFTRSLGVSRLVQLVGDERTSSWWFALMLCITQVLVAPLVYFAGSFIAPLPNRAQLRPVMYLTCIAVNLATSGGTVFVMYLITGEKSTTSAAIKAYTLPSIVIPLLKDIPLIGKIVSGHNILTYVSFISIFLVWLFLYRTRLGLRLRAVGENPKAASSVGISVTKIGYISFFLSGILCGFGGAFMSMGWVSFFMKNMVNGRGYIGLSASNIANGNPVGSAIASVFFGFCDATATTLKSQGSFPYASTIIALVVISCLRMMKLKKIQEGKENAAK